MQHILQASHTYRSIYGRITSAFVFLFLLYVPALIAQGPPGYTYCADEGESFTLPAVCHVAYGANGKFNYLYGQSGTITFNNATFGDPIGGVVKSGYYKIVTGDAGSMSALSWAIQSILNHLNNTSPLTPAQINAVADTIQEHIFVIGDSLPIVLEAFAMIDYYESTKGPMFLNSASQGGFPNAFGALDGYELVRAVFKIQQGILDCIYTPANVIKYLPQLEGRRFQTADLFIYPV